MRLAVELFFRNVEFTVTITEAQTDTRTLIVSTAYSHIHNKRVHA